MRAMSAGGTRMSFLIVTDFSRIFDPAPNKRDTLKTKPTYPNLSTTPSSPYFFTIPSNTSSNVAFPTL